jgi:hypothetical protein
LLRAKRNYHTALLARIEGHFNSLKAVLLGTDFNSEAVRWPEMFGPDPGDGKARLLRLKLLAQEQREAIAELDQEIEALPEVAAQRARERAVAEAQREAQSRAEAHRLAIEAITL